MRIILNWKVYNKLHPKHPVRAILKPVGFFFNTHNEIREKDASNMQFMYCMIVLFWVKYPKDKKGKRMAHLVWIMSVCHVLCILMLLLTNN